jgi:hypothetical protein
MKATATLILALLGSVLSMAQTEGKTDSAFIQGVDSVLIDFPKNLRNITGDSLISQGEVDHFFSRVVLPGSESCTISRYHSKEDTTASWQARMFHGEDFARASAAYHNLYRVLKKCYVHLDDGSMVYLKGEWEPANEDKTFSTCTLTLSTPLWRYRKVKVEIEILYQISDWVVNLNVFSKENDDRDWAN